MKVINISLRREDGKVECDTVFREKHFTLGEVREISQKYNCDVLISLVGQLKYFSEEKIKQNTLVYNREKKTVNFDLTGDETDDVERK